MVPLGGDDLDQVGGDIVLGYAQGIKSFFPLNTVLVAEGLPPVGRNEVEKIIQDLSAVVQKFCVGF